MEWRWSWQGHSSCLSPLYLLAKRPILRDACFQLRKSYIDLIQIQHAIVNDVAFEPYVIVRPRILLVIAVDPRLHTFRRRLSYLTIRSKLPRKHQQGSLDISSATCGCVYSIQPWMANLGPVWFHQLNFS